MYSLRQMYGERLFSNYNASLANQGAFVVLLTKFHQGTVSSGQQFDTHTRFTAWKTMMDTVREKTKWIIAGALATNATQLVQRLQEQRNTSDPSSVLSEDVAC